MSTANAWKNAIPRRMYRERRQLKSREHLGLLEKKRDYKRRAKDYHSKENVISKHGFHTSPQSLCWSFGHVYI